VKLFTFTLLILHIGTAALYYVLYKCTVNTKFFFTCEGEEGQEHELEATNQVSEWREGGVQPAGDSTHRCGVLRLVFLLISLLLDLIKLSCPMETIAIG
jgi:hypothetical protein